MAEDLAEVADSGTVVVVDCRYSVPGGSVYSVMYTVSGFSSSESGEAGS